jgi:hypothetical protein
MDMLLPKLVSSGHHPIAVPEPLSELRLEQQLEEAGPVRSDGGSTPAAAANVDHIAAAELAEQTLVRAMYFEGLLTPLKTHLSSAACGCLISRCGDRFIGRFAAFLAADPQKPRAADAFLLDGKTTLLQAALTDLCRKGLSSKVMQSWSDCHCAERLLVLLSTASSRTSFRWRREVPMGRVYAEGGRRYRGFADIVGMSGNRTIIIVVKQVNVLLDLNRADVEEELQQCVRTAAGDLHKQLRLQFGDAATQQQLADADALAAAEALARLPEEQLLRVPLTKPNDAARMIRMLTAAQRKLDGDARRKLTVAQLQDKAAPQAQQYGRGWQRENRRHSESSNITLELYSAMAGGPLRWLVQRVPLAPIMVRADHATNGEPPFSFFPDVAALRVPLGCWTCVSHQAAALSLAGALGAGSGSSAESTTVTHDSRQSLRMAPRVSA